MSLQEHWTAHTALTSVLPFSFLWYLPELRFCAPHVVGLKVFIWAYTTSALPHGCPCSEIPRGVVMQ